MTNRLIFISLYMMFFSFKALAEAKTQPHHLVSLGVNGAGWTADLLTTGTDVAATGIREQKLTSNELVLNYQYIFNSRVSVGGFLSHKKDETEIQFTSDRIEITETANILGVTVGYNFQEDIFNSWWISLSRGVGRVESESTDTRENPAMTNSNSTLRVTSFSLGKRFSFDFAGLKNISYSPSISYSSIIYSGDVKRNGVNGSSATTLNLLKFDLLF